METLQVTMVEDAVKQHLPEARLNTEGSDQGIAIKATIQGPLKGEKLISVLDAIEDAGELHSIYRSGTGLTVKILCSE